MSHHDRGALREFMLSTVLPILGGGVIALGTAVFLWLAGRYL